MERPPHAFEVSQSWRYVSGRSIPSGKCRPNTGTAGLEHLLGPGPVRSVRTAKCPSLMPGGCKWAAVLRRMGTATDNGRVTSFLSLETWQCSEPWSVGDEMFPVPCEQRDRGLCASAQMSARGALAWLAALLTNLTKWDVPTSPLKSRNSSRCRCFSCSF